MYQGRDNQILVNLVESDDGYESLGEIPASGILGSELNVFLWHPGLSGHILLPITDEDLIDLEDGAYALNIKGEHSPVLGEYHLKVTSEFSKPFQRTIEVVPVPIAVINNPSVCVVHGSLVEITGKPAAPAEQIAFRLAHVPKGVNNSLITADRVLTNLDAFGNFSVQLIRGCEVVLDIERAGIRYKFTVPDQSTAALIDLLPQIP